MYIFVVVLFLRLSLHLYFCLNSICFEICGKKSHFQFIAVVAHGSKLRIAVRLQACRQVQEILSLVIIIVICVALGIYYVKEIK